MLSLPAEMAFDQGLVAEGEGSENTAALSRLYEGLLQLNQFGRRIEEAATAVAPVPQFLDQPLLTEGLDSIVDVAEAFNDFTSRVMQPPRIQFADGNSSTSPDFNLTTAFDYFVNLDGESPTKVTAIPPSPMPGTTAARLSAWVTQLNASLGAAGLSDQLIWSETSVTGESGNALQLAVKEDVAVARLQLSTTAIIGTASPVAFGQPTGNVQFNVNAMAIRTDRGTGSAINPPIVLPNYVVSIPRSAGASDPLRTNDNVTEKDLADDINRAFAKIDVRFPDTFDDANAVDPTRANRTLATYLEAVVVTVGAGQRLAIVSRTGSVQGFGLSGTGLASLGLSSGSVNDTTLPAFSRLFVNSQVATPGIDPLLLAQVESDQKTIEQAVEEVLVDLGIDESALEFSFDATGEPIEVTFPLNLFQTQASTTSLDLSRSIALPIGDLSLEMTAVADAATTTDLDLSLRIGISLLGDDRSPITPATELRSLNSGKGLMGLVGVAGAISVASPNLTSSLRFTVSYSSASNPGTTVSKAISVSTATAADNTAIEDLIADVNQNLEVQGLDEIVEAALVDGKFHLRAIDRQINYLELRSGSVATSTALGLRSGSPPPVVFLRSTDRPNPSQLPTASNRPAYPDIAVEFGPAGSGDVYFINLDQALTIGDAISRINSQVPVPNFASVADGRLALRAGLPFRVIDAIVGAVPGSGASELPSGGVLSGAATALGIAGESQLVGSVNELLGASPDQLDLSDRVFIKTDGAGSEFNLTSTVSVENLNAGISAGMAGLYAELDRDETATIVPLNWGFQLGLALSDPGIGSENDGRITFGELLRADPTDLFATPSLEMTDASGTIVVKGELFAGEGGGQFAQEIESAGSLLKLNLSSVLNGGGDSFLELGDGPNFSSLLDQLQNLQVEDVVRVLRDVIGGILNPSSISGQVLATELPLLGTSLGDAVEVLDQLDEALARVVSSVDVSLVNRVLVELESAVSNLSVDVTIKTLAVAALTQVKREVHLVHIAESSQLVAQVSRLISAAALFERQVFAIPGVSSLVDGSGGDGEAEDVIARELLDKLEEFKSLLPTVNSVSSRVADTVRNALPEFAGVEFKFDILPDFDGNAGNGNIIAILIGLLMTIEHNTQIDPNSTQTSLGPLRLGLDGNLELDVVAQLGIGLAIELPTTAGGTTRTHLLIDPPASNPQVVKTGLSIEARASGEPLSARAGFGSTDLVEAEFNLSLTDGPAGGAPGTGAAAVVFDFGDASGPLGTRLLDANIFSDLQATGIGSLNADIDIELFGQRVEDAVTVVGSIQDLVDGTLPQLVVDEAALVGLFSEIDFDLQTIIAGIDLFLDQLQSLLRERLDHLPFIGGGLEDLGGLIEDLRTNLVVKIRETLDNLQIRTLNEAETLLKDAIFTVLNAGSFVKLRNYPGTSEGIDSDDIQVDLERDLFEIRALIGIHEVIADGFDFATNFAGLPLSAEGQGGVELDLQVEAFIGFGISRFEGFYLIGKDTPAKLIEDPLINAGDELAIKLNADLRVGSADPSELKVDLFLLEVSATDVGSSLTGVLGVNLGTGDIPVDEIGLQSDAFHGAGSVVLALDLAASLLDLPQLTAELRGGWGFEFNTAGVETQTPTLALNNIQLDLGHYLNKFIGGAADRIRDVLEPIRPVIELLRTEVPGVSELSKMAGQGPITLLDLALLEAPRDAAKRARKFLTFVDALDQLQSRLPSSGMINFGSISFDSDILMEHDWNLLAGNSLEIPTINRPSLGSLEALVAEFERDPDETPRAPTSGSAPADGLGLSFPIIDEPLTLIQMLLGQTVELVKWDIPALELDFAWSQSFPIIPTPPISVEVGLNAGFVLDLGVGFDSRGLQTGNFLDGFYVDDLLDGVDIDELVFSLGASVAALLDVGIASAGIKGEIIGRIKGNWRDPDQNGKLYVDEILHIVDTQGVGCLVDLSAELRAKLSLVWEVLFFDGSIEIVDLVLLEMDNKNACPAQVPAHLSDGNSEDELGQTNQLPQHIADFYGAGAPGGIAPAGTLIIHAGAFADLRVPGSSTDTSEEFTIIKLAPGVVRVEGMGMEATYGGVTSILFDGSAGDDQLRLRVGETGDESSYRNFDIQIVGFGGDGNDLLQGGALFDSLFGGDGTDLLLAGPGSDFVDGGDGNDTIFGDDGDDTLLGRAGNDTIAGEGGTDSIDGASGDDILWGGYSDNAAPPSGRTADGIDVIDAGLGQDFLYGGPGNDRMWGRGGNDHLEGNDGADYLDGGDGHDYLDAGLGNDPWVHGGLGNDFVMGGDGADALLGGWGNDVIIGHLLGTTIGGSSAETIEGGPDDDFICGTNGVDSIFGGTSTLGYSGVTTDFPAVPFDTRYPLMAGGYTLTSCTIADPPPPPPPVPGSVLFRVFRDVNRNGTKSSSEDYDNGWLMRVVDSDGALVGEYSTADIDLNADGQIDEDTERGVVQLTDLEPGTYRASLVLPSAVDGFENLITITTPNLGPYIESYLQVTIDDGQSVDGGDFGLYRKSVIQGLVWNDLDGDGIRDSGEPGLAGQTVYVDQSPIGGNGNYQPPVGGSVREPAAVTGPDGRYTIVVDGNPDDYYVRLSNSTQQTFPRPVIGYGPESFAGAVVGPEWVPARGSGSPGGIGFAGEYGSETASLFLNDLPDHEAISLEFDLYVIGPWTGDTLTSSLRDQFRVTAIGGSLLFSETLLNETFSNGGEFTNGQTYDGIPGSNSLVPAFTGDEAARRNELQFSGRTSSAYRFAGTKAFVFEHFGPALTFSFQGLNLESGKTWGLDHVKVTTRRGGQLVTLNHESQVTGKNFGVNTAQLLKITEKPKRGGGLVSSSEGYVLAGPDLTIASDTGLISGIRYDDVNQNGSRQSSEPRIPHQTVYVDLNGNGQLDSGEPRTLTNMAGEYQFELSEGTYTIREVLPTGFEETEPLQRPLAITQNGNLTEVDPLSGEIVHTRPIETNETISQWIGLAYDPIEQVLLATGNRSSGNTLLFEVDPITAEATLRVQLDQRLSEGDVTIQPSTGRLLAVTSRTGSGSYLVEINARSGVTTDIARFQTEFEGGVTDPSAMTFSSGGLLFVVDRNYGSLYQLSSTTGSVISQSPLVDQFNVSKRNLGRVTGMVWHSDNTLRLMAGSPSSSFNPADESPGLYRITTSGTVGRINFSATPADVSGMTLVPNMGHIVTLAAVEFDQIAPATNRNFGNIPVQYIYDGRDYVEGHGNGDTIYGDNLLSIARTISIGDDDVLVGGFGNDSIFGQEKEDLIWGGPNSDPNGVSVPTDSDTLNGGEGFNRLMQWATASQTLSNTTLTGQGTDSHVNIYTATLLAGNNGVTLSGSAFTRGPIELIGGPGNDTLRGGHRNDRIEGRGGNDLLDGNQGDDVYVFDLDNSLGSDSFTTDASSVEGVDTLDFSASETQRVFIDLNDLTIQLVARNLSGGSTGNLSLTIGTAAAGHEVVENIVGGMLDDDLRGNDSANRITGGPGSDLMYGRDGNDTFVFADGIGTEVDRLDGQVGTDTLDFSSLSNDESLVIDLRTASSATIPIATMRNRQVLRANASSTPEQFFGTPGDDLFYDGSGSVLYFGGPGDDHYVFFDTLTADTIVELPDEGIDHVDFSSLSLPLRIDLGVPGTFFGMVNTSSPFVSNLPLGDPRLVPRVIGSSIEFENVTGGTSIDDIFGNLYDNTIDGGPGADRLTGRQGNDTYVYRAATATGSDETIVENSGEGSDWISFGETNPVTSSVSIDLGNNIASVGSFDVRWSGGNIENAAGGNGDDTLIGSAGGNRLVGGPGNDILDGLYSTNVLIGGTGNDVYRYRELLALPAGGGLNAFVADFGQIADPDLLLNSRGAAVLDAAGQPTVVDGGTDRIELTNVAFAPTATVDLRGLGAMILHTDTRPPANPGLNVRQVVAIPYSVQSSVYPTWIEDVVGSSVNDTIYGNDRDNNLDGAGGSDTLFGLAGNDLLTGGGGTNSVYGGQGNDRYRFNWSATSDDTLIEADDTVSAGLLSFAGSDTLDFSNATGTGTFSFNLSTFSTSSTTTSLTPRSGTIIRLRDAAAGSLSQGKPFENVIGDSNQPNTLTGNESANMLIGGSLSDALSGRNGRDILIGFAGADTLNGENDEDILIGGSVDFVGDGVVLTQLDRELAALIAIHREWDGSASFADRQASIRAGVGEAGLNAKLASTGTAPTVLNDGVSDSLADSASSNWLIEPGIGTARSILSKLASGTDELKGWSIHDRRVAEVIDSKRVEVDSVRPHLIRQQDEPDRIAHSLGIYWSLDWLIEREEEETDEMIELLARERVGEVKLG